MRPTNRRTKRALLVGGLALAALALPRQAAEATGLATDHNEQVALADGTDKQLPEKSHINGTAPVASADGRYVVFSTEAALVATDTNGDEDVYRRDTVEGTTLLVSVNERGKVGNDHSFEPTISSDGRYVAFTTWATNLAKGDTNGSTLDVLVKDLQRDVLQRVSVTSKEQQSGKNSFSPVVSGNGRFVAFQTFGRYGVKDQDNKEDVYVRNLRQGTTRQASLLPGTDADVRGPVLNGDISDDGGKVVFGYNRNLWVRNMRTGVTTLFHHEPSPAPCQDIPAGSAGRPVISGDGRYAAFSSCAAALPGEKGDFVDVYRVNLATGETQRVHAQGNGHSFLPSLSRDGRYVGFGSEATNLVNGDDEGQTDAFVADLVAGTVVRVSHASSGVGGNSTSGSTAVSVSADGQTLVYTSYADNLVPGDRFDFEEAIVWRSGA
jgi:Tol biopolymer transport system component